jgi:hypothetical protein
MRDCCPVVVPGREPARARVASLATGSQGRHVRRHDCGLQRCGELLRLVQSKPKVSPADLLVTLNAGELGLRDHPSTRHRLILVW